MDGKRMLGDITWMQFLSSISICTNIDYGQLLYLAQASLSITNEIIRDLSADFFLVTASDTLQA